MRVIAGIYRSRILKSLKGLALRPTSDRLRETLFNVLGPGVAGAGFLDLFAGTGAIGIENHPPAAALIRRNLDSLDIESGATVLAIDALRGLQTLATRKKETGSGFSFVFLDPPYAAAEDYARVLKFLGSVDLVAIGGIVVAEHRRKVDLPENVGALGKFRVLKQGDAALSFYRGHPTKAGETRAPE
jgi:16S rRNA (guanine966-N2)-methyltransferase